MRITNLKDRWEVLDTPVKTLDELGEVLGFRSDQITLCVIKSVDPEERALECKIVNCNTLGNARISLWGVRLRLTGGRAIALVKLLDNGETGEEIKLW